MKRIVTLVVLAVAMAASVQAQGIKFGVKGGLDIQNMKFDESVFNTDNKLGWFVGPTLQISLPIGGLGVDIAGLYDQKTTEWQQVPSSLLMWATRNLPSITLVRRMSKAPSS